MNHIITCFQVRLNVDTSSLASGRRWSYNWPFLSFSKYDKIEGPVCIARDWHIISIVELRQDNNSRRCRREGNCNWIIVVKLEDNWRVVNNSYKRHRRMSTHKTKDVEWLGATEKTWTTGVMDQTVSPGLCIANFPENLHLRHDHYINNRSRQPEKTTDIPLQTAHHPQIHGPVLWAYFQLWLQSILLTHLTMVQSTPNCPRGSEEPGNVCLRIPRPVGRSMYAQPWGRLRCHHWEWRKSIQTVYLY